MAPSVEATVSKALQPSAHPVKPPFGGPPLKRQKSSPLSGEKAMSENQPKPLPAMPPWPVPTMMMNGVSLFPWMNPAAMGQVQSTNVGGEKKNIDGLASEPMKPGPNPTATLPPPQLLAMQQQYASYCMASMMQMQAMFTMQQFAAAAAAFSTISSNNSPAAAAAAQCFQGPLPTYPTIPPHPTCFPAVPTFPNSMPMLSPPTFPKICQTMKPCADSFPKPSPLTRSATCPLETSHTSANINQESLLDSDLAAAFAGSTFEDYFNEDIEGCGAELVQGLPSLDDLAKLSKPCLNSNVSDCTLGPKDLLPWDAVAALTKKHDGARIQESGECGLVRSPASGLSDGSTAVVVQMEALGLQGTGERSEARRSKGSQPSVVSSPVAEEDSLDDGLEDLARLLSGGSDFAEPTLAPASTADEKEDEGIEILIASLLGGC
ncbi:hypothetical protein CEUSTIGMA_g1871.t1 [Chlamydomonas eustigma]|uniref:Uncharacterized protein n=1 Tax=Chlamydomonas eustigma TaxID=1157962 RepID=A0A250WUW4_9CHLO|nr:hypothetical protein CEUSTIGMA_g1871.t1 [Chlamydomonas eustigma]|eukprot:GAX74422.1 hypothetical protein CEUSTIGMA_g1871.t1 [Chlamydomonas eustigma]